MSLSKLEAEGRLEPLACTADDLRGLIQAARRRLADAAVEAISRESRAENAYHAILQCALAALRVNEYRTDNSAGKHHLAIETLKYTVGLPAGEVRFIQKLRQRRHIDLYEGEAPVTVTELSEAVGAAERLLKMTAAYIESIRPGVVS